MSIQLRDYQLEAVEAFFEALKNGHKRQLITLPTGAGKTLVFGSIASRFAQSNSFNEDTSDNLDETKPILVMAHRSELLDQAESKMKLVWPNVFAGRVQGEQNEQIGDVILASTQTLVHGRELRKPSLIILDECHHGPASGTQKVLERLGVFQEDGPVLLGVTATPTRSDSNELASIFEHVTYERTILEMIVNGYLSDVRGIRIAVPGLNLGDIRTTRGDYNAKDLSLAMNEQEALDAVVQAVLEHANKRKSLVFAVDVRHAHELAERFRTAGIEADAVDGGMRLDERAEVLRRFADNETRVLVNCQILTEGYDQPDVDCIVLGRPTRSKSLYIQMVGRGLRLHPNKKDALVLDLTGASEDKTLQTFAKLMRAQRKNAPKFDVDVQDDTMGSGESCNEWIERLFQSSEVEVTTSINLFTDRSRYRWNQVDDMFCIPYGDNDAQWAYLIRDGNTFWPVLELRNQKFIPLHTEPLTLEYAQGIAENFLAYFESKLIRKDATWREWPMSDKQSEVLRRYHIPFSKQWTRGMASDALNKVFSKKRAQIAVRKFRSNHWKEILATDEGRKKYDESLTKLRNHAARRTRQN